MSCPTTAHLHGMVQQSRSEAHAATLSTFTNPLRTEIANGSENIMDKVIELLQQLREQMMNQSVEVSLQ